MNRSIFALLKHAPRQQHNALSIFFFQLKELNSKYLSSLGKSECIQELKESSGVAEIDFTIFIFNILMYFPVVIKTTDALFFES